ncbi:uncharacterized protein LOC122050410 [Zingiber officinale]|uniref:uncharacterized protein LOC122050410 n=1 Tax=Zingiber officinale TaxID=94328 RepID=UPI001C4AC881|nr:uncharacterized protein LOC122050410 [Zingiber officinale]
MPLFGFTGNEVQVVGQMKLAISLNEEPLRRARTTNFIIVDAHSAYNVILGRPALTEFRVVVSTFYQKIKFPVEDQEGEFGLKNVGATYQRLMNKVFWKQIERNLEVYVDDILIKSIQAVNLCADIEETFGMLRTYGVKLNPQKCLFVAKSGRFLGYIVTKRGIEVNPSKVKALQDMSPPRNLKEGQHLTGRITALSRFISKTADRSFAFFKILRRATKFQWDVECDKAFEELKVYLNSLPVLAKPVTREPLRVYLSSTGYVVGSSLVRSDGEEQPVYFLSHLLKDAESHYIDLEKLAFALVLAAQRLCPYFLAHPIIVMTNNPLGRKIPQAENQTTNELVKLASSISPIVIQQPIEQISLVAHIDRMEGLTFSNDWRMAIAEFLKSGATPSNREEAHLLRRRSGRFVLIGDQLYKKEFSKPLLKCVGPEDVDYILQEVYQGSCGGHPGGRSLARKILLAGYFWPTLQEDAAQTIATCLSCQKYHNSIHQPAEKMKASTGSCPFDQWGMDIVGPFPMATGQRKFLLVVVDYFSKWVEVEPLAKITEQMVKKFIWKHIICRFGIPCRLVSNNGRQFIGQQLREWCEGYDIQQHFTSVTYPQRNRQAEVTNREIFQILRVRLDHVVGS